MTQWAFSNQPYSAEDAVTPAPAALLAIAAGAADTTLFLQAGGGALLPVPGAGKIAVVRIEHELLSYTTNVAEVLGGVSRGYGGTTPAAHAVGKQVRNVIPAEYLNSIQDGVTLALASKQDLSEKGQPNGYASLDAGGIVPSAQLPAAGAPAAHAATHASGSTDPVTHATLAGLLTGDPHTQYQLRSERGAANGYAPLDSGLLVPVARLPVLGASGTLHSAGVVPDPGAVAGATRYLREDATWAVPTGGGGGQLNNLLTYQTSTDLLSGVTLPATTWTDVIADQSFTVADATKLVFVSIGGLVVVGEGASSSFGSARIVIDSAGTPVSYTISGCFVPSGVAYNNLLAGSVTTDVGTLSAGAHTIKLQAYNGQSAKLYLRSATNPNTEILRVQVMQ